MNHFKKMEKHRQEKEKKIHCKMTFFSDCAYQMKADKMQQFPFLLNERDWKYICDLKFTGNMT